MTLAINSFSPYTGAAAPTAPVSTSNYSPYTPVVSDTGSAFNTDFTSISSKLAAGAGGGFAAYKLGAQMGQNIKSIFAKPPAPPTPGTQITAGGFMTGMKNVAITGFKGAGLSALVGAGVSAVANGVGVATGKVESGQAVSNVVGDTITSAVGGLGAVTLAGLGNMALGSMGVAGLPLTIITVGLGAAGGVGASFLKDKIMNNG
ncbi:MAG: hypothetical protein IV090_26205 [Candidatus Sericytochromatia bacterium]|jgi:hypothetical protein|nr:hypothetical protein [Candidatus Sericytochromatia bacterium]